MSSIGKVLSLFLLSLTVTLSTVSARAETAKPKSLTIGFIPGENPETLKENGAEIARLIEAKIGIPVKIYVSKDYGSLIDAMKKKDVDFAFFTAMTFIFAERLAGAKVLLKKVWDGPYYHSAILVRGDSKIRSISHLKGKRIAFIDKKSTSGYLYPQVHFKKQKINPETYFSEIIFAGNHERAVQLLADGKVDAVAVFSNDANGKDTAWQRFVKGNSTQPRALWISGPIPNDPLVVRQDFYDTYPKASHDLMFALIEMDDDAKDGARFKKLMSASALMLATSQQYEPVREMVKELDLKLE